MKACQILTDWMTFVVLTIADPIEVIRDVLKLDPALFQEANGGIRGYYKSLEFGNIRVGYEPFGFAVGVCVSMSGQGCRTYESHGGNFGQLRELIHADPDINITRWDIACDIKDDSFTMQDVMNALLDGDLRSHCERNKIDIELKGRKKAGITTYIGSRQSDFFIRIYDKAKEQYDPHTEPELYNTPWIRVELVLKKQYAVNALDQMANRLDIGQFAAEMINGHMAFIDQTDSNISRCPLKGWWAEFLETLQSVKLWSKGELVHTFDKTLDWAQSKLAPVMAMLYSGLGRTEFYEKIIMDGRQRFSQRHEALLQQYQSGRARPALA